MNDGVSDSAPEIGKSAWRPPVRTFWVSARTLLVVLVILGVSGSGCFKPSTPQNVQKGAQALVKATNEDALSKSLSAAKPLTTVPGIRVSTGSRLRAVATELSSDPILQDAVFRLAWNTTCRVVGDGLPNTSAQVTDMILNSAAEFFLTFTPEAAQKVADVVLDAVADNPNDASAQCIALGDSVPLH